MAYDKVVDSAVLNAGLKQIADAIREKGGTSDNLAFPQAMAEAIAAIETDSNPILQEKTVSPTISQQTVTPDASYDGLSKVTVNAMPAATQATPSISVSSAGLITARATQTAGYVTAGTKSETKQLTTQAAQTITPSTSDKTIASGKYLTGTQTIKGDANLKAENIKSGVSIFGVAGSYEGSGGGTGGGLEELSTTITDNGMFEPGVNEYILDVPGLNLSTRTSVILMCREVRHTTNNFLMCMFQRNNLTDSFAMYIGNFLPIGASSNVFLNENSMVLYGTDLDGTSTITRTYIVYAC